MKACSYSAHAEFTVHKLSRLGGGGKQSAGSED